MITTNPASFFMLSPYLFDLIIKIWVTVLERVDKSYFKALRPAACPRDPEILLSAQARCALIDRTGSRGQAAGRRDLNC